MDKIEEVKSNLHLYLLKLAQGKGLQIPWLCGGNSVKIVREICQLFESKSDEIKSIDEFESKYLPNHIKKFPIRMMVTKEEQDFILGRRGG